MEREAYDAMAQIETTHWWFVGRRAIIDSLIARRIAPPTGARILEAGCGTGGNFELLRRFGRVQACEYDDSAREIARARSGLDVKPARLPDGLDAIDPPFDLIALFDVLEHVEEDVASLTSLAALLAPGGRIMLTVPALQMLWSSHDEQHHHHRRYSRANLAGVIDKAGLRVDYLSFFNSFLFPAAVAQRLASRIRNSRAQLDDVPPPRLNAALTRIFASERHVLARGSLPVGLSLCAICSAR
ncbi:class I SAM-dependent methyltransferase [Qipengyuania sp. MTN3-11]|uniref:class I SAM-dependent methyltransferase n=1 Tax=Qipengyuania sp. MTN3-11 TaxID=3056557 RepID=UPI0036F1EFD9